jgi:proteic killer suppression protein
MSELGRAVGEWHVRRVGQYEPLPAHRARQRGLTYTDKRYTVSKVVIKSFRSAETQQLFETGRSKRFGAISKVATRKLAQLDAAETLDFLRSPPGNRLEELRRDRDRQYSIRMNDQWRLCFRWTDAGPEDVEIVDYH